MGMPPEAHKSTEEVKADTEKLESDTGDLRKLYYDLMRPDYWPTEPVKQLLDRMPEPYSNPDNWNDVPRDVQDEVRKIVKEEFEAVLMAGNQ